MPTPPRCPRRTSATSAPPEEQGSREEGIIKPLMRQPCTRGSAMGQVLRFDSGVTWEHSRSNRGGNTLALSLTWPILSGLTTLYSLRMASSCSSSLTPSKLAALTSPLVARAAEAATGDTTAGAGAGAGARTGTGAGAATAAAANGFPGDKGLGVGTGSE